MALKEYSYFLADGRSLEVFDTIADSKEEIRKMRVKLCKEFGADDVMSGYHERRGRFHFTAFVFRDRSKVPDGWKDVNSNSDPDDPNATVFALPPPNSPDAFHLASMGGLVERASRTTSLEGAFGTVNFMREHPAGDYEWAFVRQSVMADGPAPKGAIRGNETMWGGRSPSAGQTWDPITYMDLGGKTYFRIPNKPGTEEPVCVPPDAIPVSYEKMLEADKAETELRRRNQMPHIGWLC